MSIHAEDVRADSIVGAAMRFILLSRVFRNSGLGVYREAVGRLYQLCREHPRFSEYALDMGKALGMSPEARSELKAAGIAVPKQMPTPEPAPVPDDEDVPPEPEP